MKKTFGTMLFCFLIVFPVILPFFRPGYFPTHDGEWAVVRLSDMFRTLRDLQIPARYSGELNFGYGYPLFNFAYPFPYYLGVFIHLLGIGFTDTIKVIFAGSVFLSAFFMFLASKILWKNSFAGIVSTILYVYFPYRMVDLYVRGSIGESLAFALFPLLFYLSMRIISKSSFLSACGIAVCIGILMMTHNIMTVLFMPVFIIFSLSQIIFKDKKTVKPFILSVILGFGLSAFFWIPALFEKNNILLSEIPIASRDLYFVSLEQFLSPKWGYGSPIGPNGFSYQLGLAHLAVFIMVILSLIFIFIMNKQAIKEYSVKNAFLIIILILLFTFLLFKPSNFLWMNLPLFSEINYPWIVLGILGFLISLSAGFLCKNLLGRCMALFIGIFAIFMVLPYAKPEYYFNKEDAYYLTNHATTTSSNELMPLWVKKIPIQRFINKVEIIAGEGKIDKVFANSKQINFPVNTLSESIIRINTIYYPGWRIYVDKTIFPVSYSNEKGVMDISITPGNHIVQGRFEETPLRLTSDTVSLLSTFVFIFLLIAGVKYNFMSRFLK